MRKLVFLTIIVAIIVSVLIACPESEPESKSESELCSDLPAFTGMISITGNAFVRETLTTNISALRRDGTISYQWKRKIINYIYMVNLDTTTVLPYKYTLS